MRIIIIQRFLPSRSRGGVGYFTHGLANTLVKRGHRVTVISHDPKPADADYKIQILPRPKPLKLAPLAFPFQLAKFDFRAFDMIHAQGDEQWIPKKNRPPIVRTLHGSSLLEAWHNGVLHGSPKHFFLHCLFFLGEFIADLRADSVVAVSEHTRHFFPRVHEVIGNGIDAVFFQPASGPKTNHPTVLFVGELHSRKRGHFLLQTFHDQIRIAIPNAELWMVCPEKVVGAGIRWFSNPSAQELAALYRQAWVFCLPSSYEGFGRPYAEALACGTPVVATPNPGALEVLARGEYGSIVPETEIGRQLCILLTDAKLRESYRLKGLKRAAEYSWDLIAEKYEGIYKTLISQKASSHAH